MAVRVELERLLLKLENVEVVLNDVDDVAEISGAFDALHESILKLKHILDFVLPQEN